MKIRILQEGRYNNLARKAQTCKPGDELETATGYAESLIADGLAEVIEIEETPAPEASKKRAGGRKPKKEAETPKPARATRSNPFLS